MPLDIFTMDQAAARAQAARSSADDLPATFGDAFSSAWSYATLFGQSIAGENAREAALYDRAREIFQATGDPQFHPASIAAAAAQRARFTPVAGDPLAALNERIEKARTERPDLDLQPVTGDELDALAARKSAAARQAFGVMAAREKTLGGSLGFLTGGLAGAGTDPVNMLAFPLAAPEGLGVLGTAGVWAAIGGGTQAAIELIGAPFRERVEPGYLTSGEPLENVIETVKYAGGIGGTIKALGAGWRYLKTRDWPRTIRDAGNVVESEAQVEQTNPFRGVEGEVAHREAMSKTIDDAVAGRPAAVDGVITPELMGGYQSRLAPIMKARTAALAAEERAALLEREEARLPPTMERLSEQQLAEIRDSALGIDTGLEARRTKLAEQADAARAALDKQAEAVQNLRRAAEDAPDDAKLKARLTKAEARLDHLQATAEQRAAQLPMRTLTAEARAATRRKSAESELRRAIARLAGEGYGVKLEAGEVQRLAERILGAPADEAEAALRETTEALVERAKAQRAAAPQMPFGAPRPHEEARAEATRFTNLMRTRVQSLAQSLAREAGYAMPRDEAATIAARMLRVPEPDALAILDELILRPRTLAKTLAEPPPDVLPGLPEAPPWPLGQLRAMLGDTLAEPPAAPPAAPAVVDPGEVRARAAQLADEIRVIQQSVDRIDQQAELLDAIDARLEWLRGGAVGDDPVVGGKTREKVRDLVEAATGSRQIHIDARIRNLEEKRANILDRQRATRPDLQDMIDRRKQELLALERATPPDVPRLPPVYDEAVAEQLTPKNVEKLAADPEFAATREREFQRLRAEQPDKEIPVAKDANGNAVTRTVEEMAEEVEQRRTLADEIKASCGPQPAGGENAGE